MKPTKNRILKMLISEAGFTLLEVAFAGAILVIVGLAYAGTLSQSVSISQLYGDQNQANILIDREVESLKNIAFDRIPFQQTSTAESLIEVPDYFNNVAIGVTDPTSRGFVSSSGDMAGYEAIYAFDNIRAGQPGWKRWMADVNGPLKTGGFVPQTDEPIIVDNPDDPGNVIIINPGDSEIERDLSADSQFVYMAFPSKTKIHRVIYDNRFNTSGNDELTTTEPDYKNRRDTIWQRDYQVFVSDDQEITPGTPFRPEYNSSRIIYQQTGLGYGSTGVFEVYNNLAEPLEITALGVGNISVETDFDSNYHFPYVSDIEAFGYNQATYYLDKYAFANGEVDLGNYVMFMPKYLDSDFDLFRRVFVRDTDAEFPPTINSLELFRVQIKIYPHDKQRNTSDFISQKWWQDDTNEIMEFTMIFTRDADVIYSNLPGLQDLPCHTSYFNNEDIKIPYTVPGATKIRAHFSQFEIQSFPDTDYVEFLDKNGASYGGLYYGNALSPISEGDPLLVYGFSPWVDGDTIIIHFVSDSYLSSIPNGNLGGVCVDRVEIE